jgi:L-proline amide hydrolase
VTPREGHVEWRRHRTWYRIVGETEPGRDPLLCVHGGPGSTHHYFAPLERLAGEGRAVVLYDQLGCGRSDRPEDVEWSLRLFLDELAELRTQLGLERIHLLGTSWGGMLALEHALSGYGGLTSLVLGSTLACAEEWVAETKRLRDELPADVVSELERHERAGTTGDPAYRVVMKAFDDRHFYRGPPGRQELERMARERGADAYGAMWGPNEWTVTGALRRWDVRPRLHELDVPTLVLRGRYDMSTERVTQTLVRGISGAREVVFEHSSHTPVLEETERYLDVVAEFLRAGGR